MSECPQVEGAWESVGSRRTLASLEMRLDGKTRTDLHESTVSLKEGGDGMGK